jgi:hypothetical protein
VTGRGDRARGAVTAPLARPGVSAGGTLERWYPKESRAMSLIATGEGREAEAGVSGAAIGLAAWLGDSAGASLERWYSKG